MRKKSSTNNANKQVLTEDCGLFFTLSVIGGRWKINILVLLLKNGTLRYSYLKNKLWGISERMLTTQLKELESDKLIVRVVVSQKPLHVEYTLSDLGSTLKSILIQMDEWGGMNKPQ